MLPIAVDAMGGERAPHDIVAGARQAAEELGVPVLLVGRADAIGDPGPCEVLEASEVVAMDEDPAAAVRRKKDSSLARCAEAVRDGRASAMVSAGNTGAAMGVALLRMGRLPGVTRPAVAVPIPNPGGTPTVLTDAGANAEVTPAMLVQFAQMGAAYARARYGIELPSVALLSNGEEPTKGTPLVKEAHALLADLAPADGGGAAFRFTGNVEGRDLIGGGGADVVVTDGFTGNVALKALEGTLRFIQGKLLEVMTSTPEALEAARVILPALAPIADELDPDATGGAMLLGVDGVCIISHGSSSPRAIVNACRVAQAMAEGDLVAAVAASVAPAV